MDSFIVQYSIRHWVRDRVCELKSNSNEVPIAMKYVNQKAHKC
jgi:hypothetical protein